MNRHIIFGRRLAGLRESRGLTQQMLADRMGIQRATISHYEVGRSEPDLATLVKLADFFGVTVDYMLGREGSKLEVS